MSRVITRTHLETARKLLCQRIRRQQLSALILLLLFPLSLQADIIDESPATAIKSLSDELAPLLSAPLKGPNDDLMEAVRLYKGKNVAIDRPKSYRYFISAAEQGNLQAQYIVGWMYRVGEGVTKSPLKATYWLGKAADKGHVEAMFILGVMYDLTLEVPADSEKALHWYKMAAEKGHAGSQVNLGAMYHNKLGDYSNAYHWFREAAKKGSSLAQYNLGLLYLNGEGVIRNFPMAERWFSKASEQGSSLAQYQLGRMYQNGVGVQKDLKEAISWYEKAAAQGDRKSKEVLENIRGSLESPLNFR